LKEEARDRMNDQSGYLESAKQNLAAAKDNIKDYSPCRLSTNAQNTAKIQHFTEESAAVVDDMSGGGDVPDFTGRAH